MSYAIVWEFMVPALKVPDFEAAYGPEGPWAHLFKRAAGFVELMLLRCEDHAGRYLTVDRWVSIEAFEDFKRVFAADYHALDAQFEGLASTEARLGSFNEHLATAG